MKWVSYTRSISSRIGEENPANTIAEQNLHIGQYLKKRGDRVSEKYSDRKRTADASDGFERMVQDGMARKFDAVIVDSIFRCGRTLPFAIEVLQRTFYPLGIEFAVVEDDFCSTDKTAQEVEQYFNSKTVEKRRSELIANRQNSFDEGVLTYRQIKYGYDLSEDHRGFVLDTESACVVKLIFQMFMDGMTIPEVARTLTDQGVPSPQIQMARTKKDGKKTEWHVSTVREILVNPLYIGKLTLKLTGAKREMDVPPIVSEEVFRQVQEKIKLTAGYSGRKQRKSPNLLFKKVYERASGGRLLCRTTEDESRQVYSFDKGYRCFAGKAPCIESTEIFQAILLELTIAKKLTSDIDARLDKNKKEVKYWQDAALSPYREWAKQTIDALEEKYMERTAVYLRYENGEIEKEQVEEYERQYRADVKKLEADFKEAMQAGDMIQKAFSHGNPWLMKFRDITVPEKLERSHIKKWLERVWIEDFKNVVVVLQEEKWKEFFPNEWLNGREEER